MLENYLLQDFQRLTSEEEGAAANTMTTESI